MSSDAIALHEIHHVAQSLSTGGLKFDGEGCLLNAALNLRKDSFDNSVERYSAFADQEIEAYKIQFAMDHSFPISSVNTLTDINVFSVGSIMDAKGEPVYEYISKLAEHLRLIHTFGK